MGLDLLARDKLVSEPPDGSTIYIRAASAPCPQVVEG